MKVIVTVLLAGIVTGVVKGIVETLLELPVQTLVLATVILWRLNVLSVPVRCPLSSFQVTVPAPVVNGKTYGLVTVMVIVLPATIMAPCVTELQLGTGVATMALTVCVAVLLLVACVLSPL